MKKFNGIKSFLVFLLIVCTSVTALCFTACGDKEVESITVSKNPTKMEYYVGEEFDPAGGEITVKYTDGSTEVKSMTDEDVTIGAVNMVPNEGEDSSHKTVTVRFGKKSVRFEIQVSYDDIAFTFAYGYAGKENETVKVRKNGSAERPADPVREGYTFDNWYADETLTMVFDFKSVLVENATVYAKWLENGATYFDVQFDYNYTGAVNPAPQKVKSGDKATRLAVDPTREGYRFDGWVTAASGDTAFAFDSAIAAATTIYAKWVRTTTGAETYVFEAEDTNLDGKVGKGLSGTAPGKAMVQKSTDHGASNDRFVGYLYDMGLSLEFDIVSDMDVADATIVFRFSAEMRDFDIDPDKINIVVNYSNYLPYEKISFKNVPTGTSEDVSKLNALPFKDYTIATNVKLDKGQNRIQIFVNNDEPTEGTTMTGIAPLVDCLKITTEAVLSWDASRGLPKKNY